MGSLEMPVAEGMPDGFLMPVDDDVVAAVAAAVAPPGAEVGLEDDLFGSIQMQITSQCKCNNAKLFVFVLLSKLLLEKIIICVSNNI